MAGGTGNTSMRSAERIVSSAGERVGWYAAGERGPAPAALANTQKVCRVRAAAMQTVSSRLLPQNLPACCRLCYLKVCSQSDANKESAARRAAIDECMRRAFDD